MSLPLGLQTMGVYSIGTVMPFPLELSLNNKQFKFLLFSVLYMLYLEAITQGCSFKYVFFKIRQIQHTDERYECITMIVKINIIIWVK